MKLNFVHFFARSGGITALNKPMEGFGVDDKALINETRNSVSNFKFLSWEYSPRSVTKLPIVLLEL